MWFVVCLNRVTDVRWPATARLWKKWCGWPLIMMHICYLQSELQTEELAAKFVLYIIIHRYYIMVTEIWIVLLCDWCIFNYAKWISCILKPCKVSNILHIFTLFIDDIFSFHVRYFILMNMFLWFSCAYMCTIHLVSWLYLKQFKK